MKRILLAAAVALALSPGLGVAQRASQDSSPRIAAAINGAIVLFRSDGGQRTTLTRGGFDSSPVVSSDGRMIAFLRTPVVPPPQPGMPGPPMRQVVLASPNGQHRYDITVFSQRAAISSPQRQVIAWEPGGHAPGLAWYDGNTVQYRRANGNQRTVLQVGPASPTAGAGSITFASDDTAIAAPVAPPHAGSTPARTLHIAVSHFYGGQRTITVHFRSGFLSTGGPNRGSVPVGDGLTYTDSRFPSRLHTLEFPTVATGAGYRITGLFLVPDRGGTARMTLGNGHAVHGIPPFDPALEGATHFQYAPNRKYLATDPNNSLWISGEVARRFRIPIPHAGSCVLAQWTWLSDSSGLAYVTACTVAGSSPLRYRLTLGAVSLKGGKPAMLDTLESRNPQAIDLTPAYRCVGCG